jgi:hypothetical protein
MMAAPTLPARKAARRRKLLIYGGVAAALLLLVVLSRRGGANASQPAGDSGSPSPVATPGAVDPGPSAIGQPDNTAQLAGFESSLLDQLPQVISSSIAAGFANGLPVPVGAGGAESANDPSGGAPQTSDLAASLGALGAFNVATAQLFRGTGAGGQQKAAAGGHGKTKRATSAKKAPHPATTSKHPAAHKTKHAALHNKPTGRAHRRHG